MQLLQPLPLIHWVDKIGRDALCMILKTVLTPQNNYVVIMREIPIEIRGLDKTEEAQFY